VPPERRQRNRLRAARGFAREILAGMLSAPGELSFRALMDWVENKRPGAERRLLNTAA
jgi:hypothetical protein